MTYSEAYDMLRESVCAIIFIKKDATFRIMLGTRHLHAIWSMYPENRYPLDFHDRRCNIGNGLVSVFDLEKGEGRSFNIHRLVSINPMSTELFVTDRDAVFRQYDAFKNSYEKVLENAQYIYKEKFDAKKH